MNIFVLDTDPMTAAAYHCDVHVVKMVLETTQILCGVWHKQGATFEGIYKPTHLKHPCVVWAGKSEDNYRWTLELLHCLLLEFEGRYHKTHSCARLYKPLAQWKIGLPSGNGAIEHIFCGPSEIASAPSSVVDKYREYYHVKRQIMYRPMTWKHGAPEWMSA